MAKKNLRLLSKFTKEAIVNTAENAVQKKGRTTYFFKKSDFNNRELVIRKRFGIHEEFGPCRWIDAKHYDGGLIRHVFFEVLPFSLKNKSFWFKIGYHHTTPLFVIEKYPSSIKKPLELFENKILGKVNDDHFKRIKSLIEHNLLFEIDSREKLESKLYKDPKDGRNFQLLIVDQNFYFEQINQSQWDYEYLEAKHIYNSHHLIDDKDFLEMLENNKKNILCEVDQCENLSIKNGSLCKRHHFEIVREKKLTKELEQFLK